MVANCVAKRVSKIARNLRISWEILRFSPPEIQFSSPQNPIFFNNFPLSSTAFRFPQWPSNFPQWLSTFREIQENLSTAAIIQKIAIQASYFPPLAPRAL
jgi:hypothetical protein